MKDKREIDRLIAEKVMGWKTQTFPNIGVTSVYTEDGELTIPEQFSPTENLDQAWSVLEKFQLVKIDRDSNRNLYTIPRSNTDRGACFHSCCRNASNGNLQSGFEGLWYR
ncbi:hypothetical protein ACFRGK_06505 [Bacillus subtilis]|uniref:BC1872 family protein n=1 Tax=Bacillus subtilis TaxID=1423 RepID=UPI0027956B90|nr:hypothetical protein [Bacillus subtilis]